MSALGQKRTFSGVRAMSALPQKRTFGSAVGMSALGHKRTHAVQQTASLFDHLVAMASTPGGIESPMMSCGAAGNAQIFVAMWSLGDPAGRVECCAAFRRESRSRASAKWSRLSARRSASTISQRRAIAKRPQASQSRPVNRRSEPPGGNDSDSAQPATKMCFRANSGL